METTFFDWCENVKNATRFSTSGFLHGSVSPKLQIIPLGPFRIFRKLAEIFAAQGWPHRCCWLGQLVCGQHDLRMICEASSWKLGQLWSDNMCFRQWWATQIPTLWIHTSGGRGRVGTLILDRCRLFDLFASVDAHLWFQAHLSRGAYEHWDNLCADNMSFRLTCHTGELNIGPSCWTVQLSGRSKGNILNDYMCVWLWEYGTVHWFLALYCVLVADQSSSCSHGWKV